jgi:hypothetical protein
MATIVEKPAWLTVKETARRLDLHEITVRRKIRAGFPPCSWAVRVAPFGLSKTSSSAGLKNTGT